jgi:hypothetical protein
MKSSKASNLTSRIDLADRIVAALLAPLVFILSLLIVYFVFFRRSVPSSHPWIITSVRDVYGIILAAVICPAIFGFAAGTDGVVSALGHMFLTHPRDKNIRKTLIYWTIFGMLATLIIRYLMK